ncbi:hypothetical protein GCM10027454_35250 [Algoriphagus aestuariicola]
MEALVSEAKRLAELFESNLILIHVGEKTEDLTKRLDDLVLRLDLDPTTTKILWKEQGKPVKKILEACEEEEVDLLVSGALKEEGLLMYYLGSVGRKIIRKANCSVLTLIDPKVTTSEFKKVVINGTQLPVTPLVIRQGLEFAKTVDSSQISILNEIKMYGLMMGTASEDSEEEASQTRRLLVQDEVKYVQDILKDLDHKGLRINIKVTGGRWAVELARFCEKIDADLLVVGDGRRLTFFDRIFPHDLEDILSTLPCNLLIVKK